MQKNIFRAVFLGIALLALTLAVPALAAWADVPTGVTTANCPATTPGCNTPINVSAFAQTKSGNLTVVGSLTAGPAKVIKPYTVNGSATFVDQSGFGIYKEDMTLLLTTNNVRAFGKGGSGGSIGFSNSDGFVLGAIKGASTNPIAGQYGGYLGFYTASASSGKTMNGNNNLGYERMRISQEGNVGINTTVPQATLDVIGSVRLAIGNAGLNKVLVSTDAIGRTAWKTLAEIGGGGNVSLTADATRPGIVVTPSPITGAGAIGVNPAVIQKRVINSCTGTNAIQTINENGTVTCVSGGGANYWTLSGAFLMNNVGSSVVLKNSTGSRMSLQLAGRTGAATEISGDNGTLYLGGNATSPIIFRNNIATERMRISETGNVGIGDTSPSYKLDVNGTIQTTGFRLPTGAAANYVLGSDASGNATWRSLGAVAGSCAAGHAIQSFGNGTPTCVDVGGGGTPIAGTANYLSMFNTAGTGLVNAPLRVYYTNPATGSKYLMTDSRLDVNGALHAVSVTISGGSPADGKILVSNDTSGNASWQNPGEIFNDRVTVTTNYTKIYGKTRWIKVEATCPAGTTRISCSSFQSDCEESDCGNHGVKPITNGCQGWFDNDGTVEDRVDAYCLR